MSLSKLDLFYRRLILTKFYTRGWGTPEELKEILRVHRVISNREQCINYVESLPKREFHLGPAVKKDKCRIIDGHFESPICSILPHIVPQKCRTGYFQLVLPEDRPQSDPGPICIHMAGTGDHGFSRRRELLAKPLLSKGISSLILENPYYGLRKPSEQSRSGLLQVKDLFIMGLSLVVEGYCLLQWLENEGYNGLGLTGISMGGHMASLAGTIWPKPLAIIPCMSWTSASVVWTEGVLSKAIPWRKLEAEYAANYEYSMEPLSRSDKPQPDISTCDKAKELRKSETVVFMKDVMDQVTGLQNFSVPVDPTVSTFVVAKADAYYPIHSLTPMTEIWPGCEVRYLNTGHIAGFLMHHRDFCKAIIDTFSRLSEKYGRGEKTSTTVANSDEHTSQNSAHYAKRFSNSEPTLLKALSMLFIKS